MPEEERAAAQEQECFKLRSCKHKNCKYRATSKNAYGIIQLRLCPCDRPHPRSTAPPGQTSACGLHAVRAAHRQETAA